MNGLIPGAPLSCNNPCLIYLWWGVLGYMVRCWGTWWGVLGYMVETVGLNCEECWLTWWSVELHGGECWVTSIVKSVGLHGRVLSYMMESAGLHGGIGYMVGVLI